MNTADDDELRYKRLVKDKYCSDCSHYVPCDCGCGWGWCNNYCEHVEGDDSVSQIGCLCFE